MKPSCGTQVSQVGYLCRVVALRWRSSTYKRARSCSCRGRLRGQVPSFLRQLTSPWVSSHRLSFFQPPTDPPTVNIFLLCVAPTAYAPSFRCIRSSYSSLSSIEMKHSAASRGTCQPTINRFLTLHQSVGRRAVMRNQIATYTTSSVNPSNQPLINPFGPPKDFGGQASTFRQLGLLFSTKKPSLLHQIIR
jgi:hypothetical protein